MKSENNKQQPVQPRKKEDKKKPLDNAEICIDGLKSSAARLDVDGKTIRVAKGTLGIRRLAMVDGLCRYHGWSVTWV